MKNTFDFDFKTGEFVLENGNPVILTGLDALKLWVQKCIRTQLGRYRIYNGNGYGANIEDLVIGKSYGFDFVESELKREIETALLRHDDIHSIDSFSVRKQSTTLNISFTITTSYGEEMLSYDI
ncbi:MAG: DUF2634 domain-containing protein [Candidatus Ornithomonoglobus sp.]